MSQSIQVSDEVFSRLKELAEPLVDTPETVISRLIDYYGEHKAEVGIKELLDRTKNENLDPGNPGSLAHTKVINAFFDDVAAGKWFDLAKAAHIVAYQYLGSKDSLLRMSKMNLVKGKRDEKGFDYVPEIDMSIQRADSNVTWRNVMHLAQQLSLPVSVNFEWRDKPEAARPGRLGMLEWKPNTQSGVSGGV